MKKAYLIRLAKIAVFVVGAYFCEDKVADHWYVGPIFGVVVLIWKASSWRELLTWRSGAFLVASTLIYALVWESFDFDWIENSFIAPPVMIGTILLPTAHALLLGARRERTLTAIPGIYLIYWGYGWIAQLLHLDDLPMLGWLFETFGTSTPWQVAYLVCMFAPKPVFPKRVR